MGTTAVHFVVLGAYELSGSAAAEKAAGGLGILLAVLALYAALALELEGVRRTTVLPLGRRGSGARAMEPSLAEQLQRVENEAGVRNQL